MPREVLETEAAARDRAAGSDTGRVVATKKYCCEIFGRLLMTFAKRRPVVHPASA
jgi:hypothetical protein